MCKNFIMLSRDLMESEDYFSERFTRMQAFVDLCMLAAYKPRVITIRGNDVKIEKGQVAESEERLSARWGWSRNTVRKYLSNIEKSGLIEQHKSRIITIISIKKYLIIEQQNEQQVEQQNEQQNEQPNNKVNKDNKVKKEKDTNVSQKKPKFDVWEDLTYVDEDHYAMWYDWLQYKDEIKKQYNTLRGAKTAYSHLLNLSAGDIEKARAIIDQSIMRNWDGLFDVRDYKPKEDGGQLYDNLQQTKKWQY